MVSASAEMKNSTTIGKCGSQYQVNSPQPPSCASTIRLRFSDPVEISTPTMMKPIDTS